MLDNMNIRLKDSRRQSRTSIFFYLPKFLITFPLIILIVYALSVVGLKHSYDLTYSYEKYQLLTNLKLSIAVFFVLYCCYICFLLTRSLCSLSDTEVPYHFLTLFTVVVFICVSSTFYIALLDMQKRTSLIFLTCYGMFNLYIWTLALSFLPVSVDWEDINIDNSHATDNVLFLKNSCDENDSPNEPFIVQTRSIGRGVKTVVDRFSLPTVYRNE